jgi:hypothetical protein
LAALSRLIPPPRPAPPAPAESADVVTYRTPAPQPAAANDLSSLTLDNFAGSIDVTIENLEVRLAPSALRPGLFRLTVSLNLAKARGDAVKIPVTIEFSSRHGSAAVLNKESAWIDPLNEALLAAVNTLADARLLADTADHADPTDLCAAASTPKVQARVDAGTDEEAEEELEEQSQTPRRQGRAPHNR